MNGVEIFSGAGPRRKVDGESWIHEKLKNQPGEVDLETTWEEKTNRPPGEGKKRTGMDGWCVCSADSDSQAVT